MTARDRTVRRLTALSWLLVVAVLALLAAGAALAVAAAGSSVPPQCVRVTLSAPGWKHLAWTVWCGTGSGGLAPMRPAVTGKGPLLFDGTRALDPAHCPRANPCVILWPRSPQSP